MAAATTGVEGACPYQGLAPFEADDTDLFFGRARETGALLDRLGARLAGQGSILIVTGASGVGKSSLLRAGLLPALEGTHRLITPTATPVRTLSECLPDDPQDGPRGRVILVVDQFEELFTLVTDERERQEFVRRLYELTQGPDGAGVVLGVRADYWERCAAYPQLAEAIQDGQVIVEAMTESDLRLAITGPAAAAGLELEAGLVDCILGDLRLGGDGTGRYEAGTLPLLSQALRNTWERSEPGRLTIRGYEESGRVRDAVRKTADETLQGLPAELRKMALRAFRRMTVITAGGRVARRRVTLAEISAEPMDRQAEVGALVRAFADRRLLTLNEDTVEISHDVLLTAWPALRQWIEPDLTAQTVYDKLIDDAAEWDDNHRDPSFLYRGPRLLTVQDTRPRWDRDPDSFPPPGPTVEAFIAVATREARRSVRRNRLVMAGLAGLTVLAVVAAAAAVNAAGAADRQRSLAVSRQLAAQSEVEGDPAISALLAVAAWRIAPTEQAHHRLLAVAARTGRGRLTGHTAAVKTVAFSPDGKTIATGGADGTARLWDTASRRQRGAPITFNPVECSRSSTVEPVFGRDGRTLITVCGGMVRTWDVATRREIRAPLTTRGSATAIALAPDGRTIAIGTTGGAVRLWDLATGSLRVELGGGSTPFDFGRTVNAVAFSADGRYVVGAGNDDIARLWDIATGRQTGPDFTGHTRDIEDLSLSPDGTTLATAGADDTVRLWSMATHRQIGAALEVTEGHPFGFTGVAFTPDGTRLATVDGGGQTRLWDPVTHRQVGPGLSDGGTPADDVAFSPDGGLMAVGGYDGVVRLGDPAVQRQIGTTMPGVPPIAVSQDGTTLAAAGPDTDPAVRLFDVRTQRPLGRPLLPADGPRTGRNAVVYALGFARDGKMLLTWSHDGVRVFATADGSQLGPPLIKAGPDPAQRIGWVTFDPGRRFMVVEQGDAVRIWDITSRRATGTPLILPEPVKDIFAMAISPAGTTLAIVSGDRRVRLFDVAAHRQIGAPLPVATNDFFDDVAFSPDGRTLAFTAADETIRLWDLTGRGSSAGTLTGHTGTIRAIAFSPDGGSLATASADHSVRLWDLATRKQIGPELTGHTRSVTGLVFLHGGSMLATVSDDGTARMWNIAAPADPAAAACANAGRSLTRAEWARLVPGERFRQICS